MSDVSHSFSNGEVIQAQNLNDVISDVLQFATNVQNAQLAGGITYEKLVHRNGIFAISRNIVPLTSGTSLASVAGFTLPTSPTVFCRVQPIIQPGWAASLLAINTYVHVYDTAGTHPTYLAFRRNGVTTLGTVTANQNAYQYITTRPDPVLNPITSLQDGDYIDVQLYAAGGQDPEPAGIWVDMVFKHTLVR